MYCKKCGTLNDDSSKFCKKCGAPSYNASAPVNEAVNQPQSSMPMYEAHDAGYYPPAPEFPVQQPPMQPYPMPQMPMDQYPMQPYPMQPNNGKRSLKPLIIAGCIILTVILLAVVIGVSESSKNKVNLNKYLVIETSGYDGYGELDAHIDWDAIEKKYGPYLKFTSEGLDRYEDYDITPVDVLRENVRVEFEKTENLSNGNRITYKWIVDEDEITEIIKGKITFKGGNYTVKGLDKVEKFDAFKYVKVEFSGTDPEGTIYVTYDDKDNDLPYFDYSCDRTDNLKNGDTVTVTISNDMVSTFLNVYGKVPESMSKQYTVSGLKKYVSKLSDVDPDAMEKMKSQAKEVFNSYVQQNWDETCSLLSMDYVGNILLTPKNSNRAYDMHLYLVYKIQVRNRYNKDGQSYDKNNTYYWYISFDELLDDEDGKTEVDLSDYATPRDYFTVESGISSGFFDKSWKYYGYESLDDLKKAVIMDNIDDFNHEEDFN